MRGKWWKQDKGQHLNKTIRQCGWPAHSTATSSLTPLLFQQPKQPKQEEEKGFSSFLSIATKYQQLVPNLYSFSQQHFFQVQNKKTKNKSFTPKSKATKINIVLVSGKLSSFPMFFFSMNLFVITYLCVLLTVCLICEVISFIFAHFCASRF